MSQLHPPRLARWVLTHALPADAREHVTGELDEVFRDRRLRRGPLTTALWYWGEALSFSVRFSRERLREHAAPDGGLVVQGVTAYTAAQHPRRGLMRRLFDNWTRDFRHAARRLVRAPGFAAVTILTLALAIGANTAIFSVVDAVLINPLPFPDAGRLVTIRGTAPGTDLPPEFSVSPEFYISYRDQADKLERLGMFQTAQTTVRTPDRVDRLFVAAVTTSLFTTLGSTPVAGRLPNADDDTRNQPVVVISYSLWRDWFAQSQDVIGKTIDVSGGRRQVIGVMGPEFRFPSANTSVWIRASIADESKIVPGRLGFNIVGRLKPGVTTTELEAQLGPIAKRLTERYGGGGANYKRLIEQHRPVVRPLESAIIGNAARPLWILMGAVGIILLIACANVANLFIVRAESQRRALAVRQALGAGRAALVRSLMAEALLLAALGGAFGVLLAKAGVPLLVNAAPEGIPNLDTVSLNTTALLFTAGISFLAACLFGLLPAMRLSAPALVQDLRQGDRGGTAQGRIVRNGLVVLQVASALVLLVGAGLLVRSFQALSRVDPGFETAGIFTFQFAPERRDQLVDGPSWARFHAEIMERLRAIPGVQSVGLVNELPFDEGASPNRYMTERGLAPGETSPMLQFTHAGGDYFKTMGISLVSGRLFGPDDNGPGNAPALISESAARQLWPGEQAIGKRFRTTESDTTPWHTVIGVVEDVRLATFRQERPDPLIYFPMVGPEPKSWAVGTPAYVIKTTRLETIAADVRALLHEHVPEAPMYRVFTMDGLAKRSMAGLTFTMLLVTVAGGLALVLGAVGIYGVLSYVVSRRTREIAVRMALGAERSAVRRMMVMQSARVAVAGIAIGVVTALFLTTVLETLLFGVSRIDVLTFVSMAALMLAVAVIASYLPARRASAVDPLQSLTAE